jgi:hypothetical protein
MGNLINKFSKLSKAELIYSLEKLELNNLINFNGSIVTVKFVDDVIDEIRLCCGSSIVINDKGIYFEYENGMRELKYDFVEIEKFLIFLSTMENE